jgi:hypothetical protein
VFTSRTESSILATNKLSFLILSVIRIRFWLNEYWVPTLQIRNSGSRRPKFFPLSSYKEFKIWHQRLIKL